MSPTEMQAFHDPLQPFGGQGVPGDPMEQVLSLQTMIDSEAGLGRTTASCDTGTCSSDTSGCTTDTCTGNTSNCQTRVC